MTPLKKLGLRQTTPHLRVLESRTSSGAPHQATRKRLNKLRIPHRSPFFRRAVHKIC